MVEQIEWISVDDELPDADTAVLIYPDYFCGEVGFAIMGEDGFEDPIGDGHYVDVTHWAHMPAGPS